LMTSPANTSSVGKKGLVAGYVLTVLVALFLTFDTVIKVLKLAPAVQGTTQLRYPASAMLWIGVQHPQRGGSQLLPGRRPFANSPIDPGVSPEKAPAHATEQLIRAAAMALLCWFRCQLLLLSKANDGFHSADLSQ